MLANNWKGDGAGALVAAVATLPQAVAYGLIAVSPLGPDWAAVGILASVGGAILFGLASGVVTANPFLISGPRAVTALVIATAIQTALARGASPEAALALAFLGVMIGGAVQAAAGALRLGRLTAYVPTPVLAGFVNASAVLVFLNALPIVLGFAQQDGLARLIAAPGLIEPWAAAVGGLTVAATLALEGRTRLVPAALIGLIAGAGLYALGRALGWAPEAPVVGAVQLLDLADQLAPAARVDLAAALRSSFDVPLLAGVSIGLLCAFDTVLSTTALDVDTRRESAHNRDLLSHGLINVAMGALGLLPGSGTLIRSRSAIKAGAVSRAANWGSALVFAGLLMLLAPAVAALPLWAAGGMLTATALQAVDQATLDKIRAIATRRTPYPRVLAGDVLVTLAVVATALAIDLFAAIGMGILLAAGLFVLGMGRTPIRRSYSAARIHSHVVRPPDQIAALEREGDRIAVIELQGALFFGACAALQDRARAYLRDGVEQLILDCRHLTSIDSTGAAALLSLNAAAQEAGGRLVLSCVEPERRSPRRDGPPNAERRRRAAAEPRWIWITLTANDVVAALGPEGFHDETDAALAACEDRLLARLGKLGRGERRGVIAGAALFDGLSRAEIAALGAIARRVRTPAGESVFRQGETGREAYLLLSGRMEVLIDIPGSSRRRRVSVLTEGALFGEMGLLDGAARSATVRATEPSLCLAVDAAGFERLRVERPQVALSLLRNVSRLFANRLRVANMMIAELER